MFAVRVVGRVGVREFGIEGRPDRGVKFGTRCYKRVSSEAYIEVGVGCVCVCVCVWGGGGGGRESGRGRGVPVFLEVNRQISHIPLNQQAIIPVIDFPK